MLINVEESGFFERGRRWSTLSGKVEKTVVPALKLGLRSSWPYHLM